MITARTQIRPVQPITTADEHAKKAIGVLESSLLSIGFVTINIQHTLTSIELGGLGVVVPNLAMAIVTIALAGFSCVIITALISYIIFQIAKQDKNEILDIQNKELSSREKQFTLLTRLVYLWHLQKQANPNPLNTLKLKRKMQKHIQEIFECEEKPAIQLTQYLSQVYEEDQKVILEELENINPHARQSEEKVIKECLSNRFANFDEHLFDPFYKKPEEIENNWTPEVIGFYTGFVSFISISSSFLGTYSAAIYMASLFTVVSLSIPVVGWSVLGVSVFLGLLIGLTVRHYSSKRAVRQERLSELENANTDLSYALEKTHDLQNVFLTQRLYQKEPESKRVEAAENNAKVMKNALEFILKRQKTRSPLARSLSVGNAHTYFSKKNKVEEESKMDLSASRKVVTPKEDHTPRKSFNLH
jgi:hypothetical protein